MDTQTFEQLKVAMPLASKPISELIYFTIDSQEISKSKKDKLKQLIEKSFKFAPITSHYEVKTKQIIMEIYISLEDITFDFGPELEKALNYLETDEQKTKFKETIGYVEFLTRLYYSSIAKQLPDVFKRLKEELNFEFDIDNIYYDADKSSMYIDEKVKKRIVSRISFTDVEISEK